VRWRFCCCVSRNLLTLMGVQCAFRAKPILGGRSAWSPSVHPELIGKKRRLLLLVMIFHKFLSSQSKTTGDPDRSISAWLDPPFDPFQSSASPIAGS
jgi:hypothetical protein